MRSGAPLLAGDQVGKALPRGVALAGQHQRLDRAGQLGILRGEPVRWGGAARPAPVSRKLWECAGPGGHGS